MDFKGIPDLGQLPKMIEINIKGYDIEKVSQSLRRIAVPDEIESVMLKNWILRYGEERKYLKKSVFDLTNWIANNHPPWSTTRSLMDNRIFDLNKCPGVRPVGIREIWRRCIAKVIILL